MPVLFLLILLLQSFSLIICQSEIYEVYTTNTEIKASSAEWTGFSRDLVECTMMRLSTGGHGNRSYFSYCPASNECILGGPDTQIITTAQYSTTYRSKVRLFHDTCGKFFSFPISRLRYINHITNGEPTWMISYPLPLGYYQRPSVIFFMFLFAVNE